MKTKKILRGILLGLLIFVLVVLAALQIGVTLKYWDYFSNSKTAYTVPGIRDDFVPQGYDYIPETDTFLTCGYMSDDTASRVYVRAAEGNGYTSYFAELYYADMTPYTKHAGGICHNGAYVYIAGDDGVDVFYLADILEGRGAVLLGTIYTGHDMAFCSFYNGYLLAGNFYYPEHYETPEHHRITTPAGDTNTSLITVFRADPDCAFGIDPQAVAAFSTTDKVQGMCFTSDNEIVLSISWSLTDSNLLFYAVDLERAGTVEVASGEVPLYYLDSANLTKTVVMPPMSEELVYLDGHIYVMNESACNKYIYGKLIRGRKVYMYDATAG